MKNDKTYKLNSLYTRVMAAMPKFRGVKNKYRVYIEKQTCRIANLNDFPAPSVLSENTRWRRA